MKKSNLGILFFTLVVVMLGFGIVIPIIPFYVEKYGANGTGLGLLQATFSIMQFFFSPIWGNLSDRFGRKKILLVGVFGNALSQLLFGLSQNMEMMLLSRSLAGILSSATLPTAMAYISDSTSEKDRGGGMGMIGAAMGVGMVLGPGLGGWLGGQSLTMPFFVASGLSIIAMALIALILPESLPASQRTATLAKSGGNRFAVMWKALFGPIGFLLFLAFLVNFGLANFEGIFGLYAKRRFNYGPTEVGTILTVIGVISALIQGFLTGVATRRLGEQLVIKLSLIGSAVGFVLMLFAVDYALILLTVGFFVFSTTMLRPSISSLISKQAEGGQGTALGLSSSFESLGRVVGPLWAGALFDVNLTLPYESAAVVMGVAFILSIFWLKPNLQVKNLSPQGTTGD